MRRRPPEGLLSISPGDLTVATGENYALRMRACVAEGGLRAILLREPGLSDRTSLALLAKLCELRVDCPALWIGVHDRPHLALATGADGVHLGFRSLSVDQARRVVGVQCVIGLSTHAGDDPARFHDADYLFHGPVLDTPSKRGLVDPIGEVGLARFCASTNIPVWGIGGLDPAHASILTHCGARGAAVLRGVAAAADPVEACRSWNLAWRGHAEPAS
ncbi:MAG: thiamine phosphate synthase [Planctomycetes bacterium]|nr:thiamine phosphate synthase [Planctomycetota bacterium]MCB9904027.1 thiamine phosphate synthase [Planctomycetota bacterium]